MSARTGDLWAMTLVATAALGAVIAVLASAPSEPRVIEVTTSYTINVNGRPVECRRHEDRVTNTTTIAC